MSYQQLTILAMQTCKLCEYLLCKGSTPVDSYVVIIDRYQN